MRDQPAVTVDDIGVAALADLDRGDDIPDQLQIDLGGCDAGVAAALRHGHRHVGLGFLAEINRAEPYFLGQRLFKPGIGRVIGTAADHVHRQTRDLELLVALAVELDQLGDRRHLPLQPAVVEAALIDRRRGPLRRRRPTDLLFDLGDKLFDVLRRRVGLFALQPDRRVLGLVIGEPDIEQSIDQQHQADEPDESEGVFRKEPPARPHFWRAHALSRGAVGWDPRVDRRGHPFTAPAAASGNDAGSGAKSDISTRKTLSPRSIGRKAIPSFRRQRAALACN